MLGVSILSFYKTFRMDFETVLTVWYSFFILLLVKISCFYNTLPTEGQIYFYKSESPFLQG